MDITFLGKLFAGIIIVAVLIPIIVRILTFLYFVISLSLTGIKSTITILYRIGRKRLSGEYTAKEAWKAFFKSCLESNYDLD